MNGAGDVVVFPLTSSVVFPIASKVSDRMQLHAVRRHKSTQIMTYCEQGLSSHDFGTTTDHHASALIHTEGGSGKTRQVVPRS